MTTTSVSYTEELTVPRVVVRAGQLGMSLLGRLVRPIPDLIRWGEPWAFEDEDSVLDGGDATSATTFNLWS